MLNKEFEGQLISYCKRKYKNHDSAHDFSHVRRVVKLVKEIVEGQANVNLKVLQCADLSVIRH